MRMRFALLFVLATAAAQAGDSPPPAPPRVLSEAEWERRVAAIEAAHSTKSS